MSLDMVNMEIARLRHALQSGPIVGVKVVTPWELAYIFDVDVKTAVRWVDQGKFPEDGCFLTLGGHHRFFEAYVHLVMFESGITDAEERNARLARARKASRERDAKGRRIMRKRQKNMRLNPVRRAKPDQLVA